MNKIKNILIILLLLLLTLCSMLLPEILNTFSDYYIAQPQKSSIPEAAEVSFANEALTKEDAANILLNSAITTISNKKTDVDNREIVSNVIKVFSDIYGDTSEILMLIKDIISDSEAFYIEPMYGLAVKNGETVILEMIYVRFDCGIDITYETQTLAAITISINNTMFDDNSFKLAFYLEENENYVDEYYIRQLNTTKYFCEFYTYFDSLESYNFNAGLNFSPENDLIYKEYTN